MRGTNRFRAAVLVLCVAAAFTSCRVFMRPPRPPAPPVTYQLECQPIDRERVSSSTWYFVEISSQPPEQLVAEPQYSSEHPLYGSFQLANSDDNRYTSVIDESKGTGSGYDTIYIDANNNENLADDAKLSGTPPPHQQNRLEFPLVEISVEIGGREYPYYLTPSTQTYRGRTDILVSSSSYCLGELTFGEKTYPMALFDDDRNGLFNDIRAIPSESERRGQVYTSGDVLVFDLDGDGKFQNSHPVTAEMYHVGKYISFGDTCYELDIAPHGRSMTVRETETPCGYIKTKHPNYSVELLGDSGPLKLNSSESTGKVPVGEYRLATCLLEREDDEGVTWRIFGRGNWRQPVIEVKRNRKAALEFGPPLTARITLTKQRDVLEIGLDVTGRRGETYPPRDFARVGKGLPAPRFEVRDEKGDIVVSSDFEYG